MTGRMMLSFIPAVAAVVLGLRARRELHARVTAEARLAELERAAGSPQPDPQPDRQPQPDPQPRAPAPPGTTAAGAHGTDEVGQVSSHLLGVLSHELRSPISAILGYQELLAEGIFGTLDPRAEEALGRIRHSAVQLLNLTDGIVELAGRAADRDPPDMQDVAVAEIIDESIDHLTSEGAGRAVTLAHEKVPELPEVRTDRARVRRVLDLILAAAVKASPNSVLTIAARADGGEGAARIDIDGVRLDAERDVPRDASASVRTGVALRLAMARRAALGVGGSVAIDAADDATFRVSLRLPSTPRPTR